MFNLIRKYIENMSIEDFNAMALNKGIYLNRNELDFSYKFVKENWEDVISNYDKFDLNKYKDNFSSDNFNKICNLAKEAYIRYGNYLK